MFFIKAVLGFPVVVLYGVCTLLYGVYVGLFSAESEEDVVEKMSAWSDHLDNTHLLWHGAINGLLWAIIILSI